MKEKVLVTSSKEETQQLGAKLGKLVSPNMVFLLAGDLGAGKTTLTQGIAKGMGITRNVTSPTFTICKIYPGKMPLYHIDAYRLENNSQELGFEEFLDDNGLTVIEWAQFVPSLIPEEFMSITIKLLEENSRQFSFEAHGKQYEELLEELS